MLTICKEVRVFVWTDRPPQTYFFTSQTAVTVLITMRAKTTTAMMMAVLGEELSTWHGRENGFRLNRVNAQLTDKNHSMKEIND